MKQTYHLKVVTNVQIRNENNGSNLRNFEIAEKFNILESTVSKWKNCEDFEDKSSKLKKNRYVLFNS